MKVAGSGWGDLKPCQTNTKGKSDDAAASFHPPTIMTAKSRAQPLFTKPALHTLPFFSFSRKNYAVVRRIYCARFNKFA
jgi:hypothetical protein